MKVHRVRRVGNSNMLALPRDLEDVGFGPGTDVLIHKQPDGTLVLVPTANVRLHGSTSAGASAPTTEAPTLRSVRQHRDEIAEIAHRYGVDNVRVIGSVARGHAEPKSDVDFLVTVTDRSGGWAYFQRMDDMRRHVEKVLGRSVDIIDEASVDPDRVRDRVLRDARPL